MVGRPKYFGSKVHTWDPFSEAKMKKIRFMSDKNCKSFKEFILYRRVLGKCYTFSAPRQRLPGCRNVATSHFPAACCMVLVRHLPPSWLHCACARASACGWRTFKNVTHCACVCVPVWHTRQFLIKLISKY